jgi:hypothetical protein
MTERPAIFHGHRLSRRGFLQGAVLIAGLLIAGALSVRHWGSAFWPSLRSRLKELLVNPALPDARAGHLPEAVVNTLLKTTHTLVDAEVETTHYAEFFRWRAETLGGYRALYERFAATLDRAATEAGERDFAACGMVRRRQILQHIDPTRNPMARIYAIVFRRDALRFEKYILRQILTLFSQTDGWVLLGYESWPGTPRGLESYTKAPRSA